MNEEWELADSEGRPSPIFDCIEETHNSYNDNLKRILSNFDKEWDALCIGSHNTDTCNLADSMIREKDLTDSRIIFG